MPGRLSTRDLIRLNTEIENFVDSDGDLTPISGKDSAIFAIHRYEGGYVCYFRYDVPPSIRQQIEALDPEEALYNHDTVKHIPYALCSKVFAGKGYYFDLVPSPDEFPDAVLHEGCYVIMADGKPVSWAWTQDRNDRAAELAVETLPEYRRRGHARQVVAASASDVVKSGRVAFFSHKIGNVPSEALARSLGVVQCATRWCIPSPKSNAPAQHPLQPSPTIRGNSTPGPRTGIVRAKPPNRMPERVVPT